MSQTIKLKRGLEASRSSITPQQGEIIYTTDNNEIFIGDGSTAGAVEIGYLNKRTGGTVAELVVTGNLTVNGTTTTVNSNDVNIGDAAIFLNSDLPGNQAPSEDAGFIINRGSSDNVSILWNEVSDEWQLDKGGVTARILDEQDGVISTINAGTGSFSAAGADSSFAIVGQGGVSTSIAGNTLTISATEANSGSLDVTVAEDGATGDSVYITTGTGFDANSASNFTYDIHVGPSLSNLADIMTGTTSGFLKKTGEDTYVLDNSTYDNYGSWTLAADTGSGSVNSADSITFAGGAGIETVFAGGTLTIDQSDVTRTDTTSSASPSAGASFTVIDTIVSDAKGNVTDVNTKTVTLPIANNITYSQSAKTTANGAQLELLDSDGLADGVNFLGNSEADGTGVVVQRVDADNIRVAVDVIDGGTF